MRGSIFRLACLVTGLTALSCGMAFGQGGSYSPPDIQLPIPTGNTQPAEGGLFFVAEFVDFRQTVPLRNQTIAYFGFVNVDGSINGSQAGGFIGSKAEALNVRQVSGPQSYQPGTRISVGWDFGGNDASTLTLSWMWISSSKYNANVTLANKFLQEGGPLLPDSFQFSPVYNFPVDYAGPANKVNGGSAFAAFGIWNASTEQFIQYTQKAQQWDLTYRVPYYETECFRLSGMVGPRFFWLWDDFQWTVIDFDNAGNSSPFDTAIYSNVTSNRMYGVHVGLGNEWYWGHGFAGGLDVDATAYLDIVKERTEYRFAARFTPPISKLSRTDYTIAGEASANASITWYVYEGIEIHLSYDLMAFANTLAATRPVGFDWGAPSVQYDHVNRFFDGFTASIAFKW
jgi:hypothetical protein